MFHCKFISDDKDRRRNNQIHNYFKFFVSSSKENINFVVYTSAVVLRCRTRFVKYENDSLFNNIRMVSFHFRCTPFEITHVFMSHHCMHTFCQSHSEAQTQIDMFYRPTTSPSAVRRMLKL